MATIHSYLPLSWSRQRNRSCLTFYAIPFVLLYNRFVPLDVTEGDLVLGSVALGFFVSRHVLGRVEVLLTLIIHTDWVYFFRHP